MRYPEVLGQLYARTNDGIKLGLDVVLALLEAAGRPQARMRHVVVAGTNGKGSTSTLIAGALRAAGHRVGHYTSPHLLRFTERIRVDGAELAASEVERLYAELATLEGGLPRPATFFEMVTVMALRAFAEREVDVAVLEVGLGGRLDATNAVDKLLAVITPIGLDHQRYLGDTIGDIAREKGGIIPANGEVVIADQEPAAWEALTSIASERGARVVRAARATPTDGALRLQAEEPRLDVTLDRWPPGAYQIVNVATAATACATLDRLGLRCPPEALAQASATWRWPGRFQWLETDPPVLLDGAHNVHGATALAASLEDAPSLRGRNVHAVFTALADKPLAGMAAALAPRVHRWYACPVSSGRTLGPAELAAALPHAGVHASTSQALDAALSAARADGGIVLVTGSLFLVGEALAALTGERRDPPVDG